MTMMEKKNIAINISIITCTSVVANNVSCPLLLLIPVHHPHPSFDEYKSNIEYKTLTNKFTSGFNLILFYFDFSQPTICIATTSRVSTKQTLVHMLHLDPSYHRTDTKYSLKSSVYY